MQTDLFSSESVHDLAPGVRVLYRSGWIPEPESDRMEAALREGLAWEQHRLGSGTGPARGTPLPRLTAWHGDPGAVYRYSGIDNRPRPWTSELLDLRDRVTAAVFAYLGIGFVPNACLLNRYRGPDDSVGWHRDAEPALGPADQVVIVSVSFGARRRFLLRPLEGPRGRVLEWRLGAGDLLIMGPGVQAIWEHCAPKEERVHGERISLTFRRVVPSA